MSELLQTLIAGHVRNVCILAHVDHGKTTLADRIIANSGIISNRLAGKLRYMDSRQDEQERGITMKSSSVALTHPQPSGPHVVHLIDSPGHVDFSQEVCTAVRLCDGAIVVVDVVEGVQPQTKAVLAQAWHEGIKTVLVLNKMDRLITEVKLEPLDAYLHLRSLLEQVNAVIGELFAADVMENVGEKEEGKKKKEEQEEYFDWSTGLDDADDSEMYFSPEAGNVLFASAYDGWAFDLATFAKIFSKKLGFNENVLKKTLWGDFFINMKAKKIQKGALEKAKKPLFVQFALDSIWAVYDTAVERKDKDKLLKMIESLNIKVHPRDLRSTDVKQHVNAIFSQWLPLAPCLLNMVCEKLPAPNQLNERRVRQLMCSKTKKFESLPAETQKLKEDFMACSSAEGSPVIAFISKMFPVPKSQLPKYRPKPLTAEEMADRREKARLKAKEKASNEGQDGIQLTEEELAKLKLDSENQREENEAEAKSRENETAFIAFARVFSGTLKPGDDLYILGPKYDPAETLKRIRNGEKVCDEEANIRNNRGSNWHIMKAKVDEIYLLLGRELESLSVAPVGHVIGIGGLEDYVLKSATLSNDVACPAFVEVTQSAVPIMRVAVEPSRSSDMAKLVKGLHLLNQADAHVQVYLTDKGEHILVTMGEVHLERCLRDLKETYAGVEVIASAPIVPFRETIVTPPKTDMMNEELGDENRVMNRNEEEEEDKDNKGVIIETPNKRCKFQIRAVPLPEETTKLLENNSELFKVLQTESMDTMSEETLQAKCDLRLQMVKSLEVAGKDELVNSVDDIWSVGPKKCGPNLLINKISGYKRGSIWEGKTLKESSELSDYDSSMINGFQLSTLAGPLCEEPMMGVAFIIEEFSLQSDGEESGSYGPLSGQVVSTVKEGCRRAFQANPQRLMAAMYTCSIQVKVEVLGKLFANLGKRHGKVVQEDMIEGSSTFVVTAHLPVVESFQFAQEIRRQTSGLAMPQLVFSHWEVVDVDPFWVPQTEEEITHFGEKADSENQARRYMNDIRKKKGLAIDEKIVEFAEKQRTLTKMK